LTLGVLNNRWLVYARMDHVKPLWPAGWWFNRFSVHDGMYILLTGYAVASVLVLVFPERRLARVGYAFMLLQYMAMVNSFDKINHSFHAWLFVSTIFILLPAGRWHERRSIAERHYFLTVFWCAQLVVLLTYTFTGAWKVYFAFHDLVAGHLNAFNISGFSYIVANRLSIIGGESVLGSFFVHNQFPGWALFLGTMYFETTSVIIAFRPRLHRAWGVVIVFFHLGTQLVLGFTFTNNVLLVILILVCSPLAADRVRLNEALLDVPGVHFIARRLRSGRAPVSAPVVTDRRLRMPV
jgi:hypothetical protein